ncbi:RHS repeat-associated core domain-containing protein [Paenimyroides baculatum]|uniref:RHS repeat-associated core domain-containing protein n=1 Tax=Paenimyroides baculatum TaxID=2608000 RepID=UPI001CC1F3E0|nr:RHS repeat-associated core domain-containing protein [Paenimyroides baculatum]
MENPKDGVIQVSEIIEKSDYYPFGLKQKGNDLPDYSTTNKYKYAYGGKELNDELGLDLYDFGARNYDAAIGRWLNVDPLAENSRRWTPYNYVYNNPIFFVDPDGIQSWSFSGQAAQDVFGMLVNQLNASDNDCESCKTEEDWENYYQQARNTASMVGALKTVTVDNKEFSYIEDNEVLTSAMTEDGKIIYYLNGERMDLRRYSNRAHAAGAMLGDAALLEGGARFFKYLSSFFGRAKGINPGSFSDEIISINKKFADGTLLNSTPSSAVNTALYYDNVVDQGASIFRSIAHGHMFGNGNERTAVEVYVFKVN